MQQIFLRGRLARIHETVASLMPLHCLNNPMKIVLKNFARLRREEKSKKEKSKTRSLASTTNQHNTETVAAAPTAWIAEVANAERKLTRPKLLHDPPRTTRALP